MSILDEMFAPDYTPSDLVFSEFYYIDPVKLTHSRGHYHLTHFHDGRFITACGIQSHTLPTWTGLKEPQQTGVCPMCSSRSPQFSKEFYGGRKLRFLKSKRAVHQVAHDSDEEAYRTVHEKPGMPDFIQREISKENSYRAPFGVVDSPVGYVYTPPGTDDVPF